VRLSARFVFVLIVTLWVSAAASEVLPPGEVLVPVGTLSTPEHTARLTGLDNAMGLLYAVADLPGDYSCMYLIDRSLGTVARTSCLSDTIAACGDDSLNFRSNAYIPDECLDCGTYVVGDECGAIIDYSWGQEVIPDTIRTFTPTTFESHASGMFYHGGYYYAIDPDLGEIHRIVWYSMMTDLILSLPENIIDPSGLTVRGSNYIVVSSSSDSLWEVNSDGVVEATYQLPGVGGTHPTGVTMIGDSLYVCSQDTVIRIYVFGESYSEPVPEGDDVHVEVVPDEAAVTFDAVTDSGALDVEVISAQPCPPPGGVKFFSDYYDMSTDATFEYIAMVELMTDTELPEGVDAKKVRVFKRPSGQPCQPWRDVTVAPLEFIEELRDPALRALTRTQSEDDEFSMFVLGEDKRNPRAVITLKFAYLDSAVIGNQDSIPTEAYSQMTVRIAAAKLAANAFRFTRAARLVDRVAHIARTTTEIPHTYKPGGPQRNIAGQIIGRAHTLSFSLRELLNKEQVGPAPLEGKSDPQAPADEFAPRLGLIPNPSVSGCTIMLSGGNSRPVDLSVYSVTGELVKTLLEGELVTGDRSMTWDGRNDHGRAVATGTYFVVLKQGEQVTTEKVILRRQ
jgi:hypothetical protein